MRNILSYATPIWLTQMSSSHLGKLEVILNKALRIATGCYQKAAASHLRAKTKCALPLRAHLELYSQQFYASALQPLHPSHLIVISPPPDLRSFRATLQVSYHRTLRSSSSGRSPLTAVAPTPWVPHPA